MNVYVLCPAHRAKVIKALYDIDNKYIDDRKTYGIETTFKIVDET